MLCLNKLGNFLLEFPPDFDAALIASGVGFVRCSLMITVVKQAIGDPFFERQAVAMGNLWNFEFNFMHAFYPL